MENKSLTKSIILSFSLMIGLIVLGFFIYNATSDKISSKKVG